MKRRARTYASIATALLLAACSGGGDDRGSFNGTDASAPPWLAGDASADAAPAATCEPGTPKARGATQSCCPDYGVDACGPMLVCAALDGRTVPVCYPEKARKYGETCTSDALCGTGHCNTETGLCDGGPQCPPCNFPLTCTRQSFMDCFRSGSASMFDESLSPAESSQEALQAKPAGQFSGACTFDHGPNKSKELLACTYEDPSTPWRVVETGGPRRLIVVRVDHSVAGDCYGTTRWICPLP